MSFSTTPKNWREFVGRFSVELEVTSRTDITAVKLGVIPSEKVRRVRVSGVVDTGATRLVLPASVVESLGLQETGEISVRFADGRRDQRKVVADAQFQIGDRVGVFSAVVEPGRTDPLIGAIVLEELDLLPDGTTPKLVPRDPHGLFAEIETC